MIDVKELHDKAVKLNKKIDKLSAEYATIIQQIADNCQHEELEDKSYSDSANEAEGCWQQCKLCGKGFNLKIRYTGFG